MVIFVSLRQLFSSLFFVLALLLVPSGFAAASPGVSTAEIDLFDLKTGKLVYTASLTAVTSGNKITVQTIYADPGGKIIQRTSAVCEKDSLNILSYTLEDHRSGRREEIRVSGGKVKLVHQERKDEKPETEEFEWEQSLAASATVVAMIERNMELLKKGGELAFDLIVPSRLDTVGFRLEKDSETSLDGRPVTVIRMEPDSWLIRQLVEPMYFYMSAAPSPRLLEYRGRVSLKTDGGQPQDLRLVYRYGAGG